MSRSISANRSDRGNVAVVKVVETKEMETGKIEFINATQMDQAITDTGKVVIYGILFDFDKDVVKPESKPTLDEIAKLLQGKPDLKVKIVGHTDNKGTAEYNLDLSSRRAANVRGGVDRELRHRGRPAELGRRRAHPADRLQRHR